MRLLATSEANQKLNEALAHMSEALSILDRLDAPGEIGSHLDLAIARLESVLGPRCESVTAVQQLMEELEREMTLAGDPERVNPVPWAMVPV